MHELFHIVLNRKDLSKVSIVFLYMKVLELWGVVPSICNNNAWSFLSRFFQAGDLFHLKDSIILLSVPSVIAKIQEISSSPMYVHNDNDQSVVEICIARITAAVR